MLHKIIQAQLFLLEKIDEGEFSTKIRFLTELMFWMHVVNRYKHVYHV